MPTQISLHPQHHYNFELDGHWFCDDTTGYLPLLEPVRGKNNRILKTQPRIEKKPPEMVEGAMRIPRFGYKRSSGRATASTAASRPKAPMTAELQEVQGRLRKEFWEKNSKACEDHNKNVMAVRDAKWPSMTDDQKIAADDRRFLKQAFKDGELSDPITMKLRDLGMFLDNTRRVGVKYKYY
ncbi:hypothetical protein ACEPPN_016274 [Leptodophora sp. 'Broadleaf-Isolate-01']